jgi:hypothetical protein
MRSRAASGFSTRATFTEFGNVIQAELISPPIHGDGKRVFMPWFELDVETGVGLASGQGDDPQIMLSISDDGGRTWSDQEPWRTMGRSAPIAPAALGPPRQLSRKAGTSRSRLPIR